MSTEKAMLIAVQNAQADLRAGFTTARDMSSHGNGYADIDMRDAINQGRFDGPRYQVSTLRHCLGRDARHRRAESARQHGRAVGRGGARGGARSDCARRRLDQAVSRRQLLIHAERRSAVLR